ncbi:MAG: hypothetical protein ABI548_21380 [Polyangiaceae bacterium]
MSQEVARLEELLARVQRNAALPRSVALPPTAFAAPAPTFAVPPPAPVQAAPPPPAPSEPYFEPPPPPAFTTDALEEHFFDSVPAPALLDQSVDDMLLADPFPSQMPAPPAAQAYTDMLDEDPVPLVRSAAHRLDDAEDISGVMTVSQFSEQVPEELLEDDIVEVSVSVDSVAPAGNELDDDLNFGDDEISEESARTSDEPPASSSRHKVAGTMDEALARAAEQIDFDEGREVPLKTPPPESGPQEAMPLPMGIHAPLAPDIEELLEADILPAGGVYAAVPTTEQVGQTIDLEEARGPHLELDSALSHPAPLHAELPHEELEVTLPRREFGGGYQDDLMPPPEARQELDAHRNRYGDDAPPPESLAQYPSQQPEASPQAFAPVIVPANVSNDPYTQNAPMVTVDAPSNAAFAPELLARPDINPGPVAKFIRVESPRPSTFLQLLDASLDLGRN